jgi:hypothetical protein
MPMKGERHAWVAIANFGAGWEADLAVARLDAEDIPARARGNDLVGIFGPGFQGATARGFLVEVPVPFIARAQSLLARPPADESDSDDAYDADAADDVADGRDVEGSPDRRDPDDEDDPADD